MILRTLLTVAVTMGPLANAVAATAAPPTSEASPQTSTDATDTKDLVGRQVIDRAGENIGDVTAVLRNASGGIKQLVVQTGGKHILLPMQSVTRQGDVLRTTQAAAEVVKLPSAGPPYDTGDQE